MPAIFFRSCLQKLQKLTKSSNTVKIWVKVSHIKTFMGVDLSLRLQSTPNWFYASKGHSLSLLMVIFSHLPSAPSTPTPSPRSTSNNSLQIVTLGPLIRSRNHTRITLSQSLSCSKTTLLPKASIIIRSSMSWIRLLSQSLLPVISSPNN